VCCTLQVEANALLQQQFYHSFTQRHGDVAIMQISSLLIDDIPDTDPRWAESEHQGDSCVLFSVRLLY